MAADRPYGEFYDFYSVSPEYFGYTLVMRTILSLPSFRGGNLAFGKVHGPGRVNSGEPSVITREAALNNAKRTEII
jgi:hypothetical protein